MNEPKRWLNDGAPPVIGQVLRAAETEQPPSGSVERALASVALGAAATSATASAAGAVGTSSGVFLKWTLLGCAITLGTAGAGLGLGVLEDKAASNQPAPATARSVASVKPRPTSEPAVMEGNGQKPPLDHASGSPQAPAERRRGTQAHTAAPSAALELEVEDVDVLAQETRLIERARAANAEGRATAAIAALDEYEQRFPVRRYGPEALYLRMEALIAMGDRRAAQQVATRLATRYPNSPHAARAESVRGAKIP